MIIDNCKLAKLNGVQFWVRVLQYWLAGLFNTSILSVYYLSFQKLLIILFKTQSLRVLSK